MKLGDYHRKEIKIKTPYFHKEIVGKILVMCPRLKKEVGFRFFLLLSDTHPQSAKEGCRKRLETSVLLKPQFHTSLLARALRHFHFQSI